MFSAGFAWMIIQMNSLNKMMSSLDNRVTIIETVLSMMGMPIKDRR
jgi:hypothetical protein